MLYSEIIAVCSNIHTKRKDTFMLRFSGALGSMTTREKRKSALFLLRRKVVIVLSTHFEAPIHRTVGVMFFLILVQQREFSKPRKARDECTLCRKEADTLNVKCTVNGRR